MLSGRPSARVVLISDNDRMYHRVGAIGNTDAANLEIGDVCAAYPSHPAWLLLQRRTYPDSADSRGQ